ncbi:PepSY domain-containing protein [Methanobacterium sp. SMA-27]|uniref:PepSY domain-containing protein n=1 Tax=Methanobacterium sp. SMA-27 TaxID=1495336 RepID=UPI00064FE56A|nr:PepSY domain-containing protein [Methanobacterium sp. SMA-27]
MDNTVKLLIIVITIFAVIGFTFNSNNTLVKYPSLITTNQLSTNSNIINPNEAISIANSNIPAFGEVRYGVTLIQNGQNPYYLVTLYENDPGLKNYGQPIVVSKVDARTGKFLGAMI